MVLLKRLVFQDPHERVNGYGWIELLQVTACSHGDEQFIGHVPTCCVRLSICGVKDEIMVVVVVVVVVVVMVVVVVVVVVMVDIFAVFTEPFYNLNNVANRFYLS